MNQTKRLNEKIISLVTCLDDGGRVVAPPVSKESRLTVDILRSTSGERLSGCVASGSTGHMSHAKVLRLQISYGNLPHGACRKPVSGDGPEPITNARSRFSASTTRCIGAVANC
jgi:hypothetical protein